MCIITFEHVKLRAFQKLQYLTSATHSKEDFNGFEREIKFFVDN